MTRTMHVILPFKNSSQVHLSRLNKDRSSVVVSDVAQISFCWHRVCLIRRMPSAECNVKATAWFQQRFVVFQSLKIYTDYRSTDPLQRVLMFEAATMDFPIACRRMQFGEGNGLSRTDCHMRFYQTWIKCALNVQKEHCPQSKTTMESLANIEVG